MMREANPLGPAEAGAGQADWLMSLDGAMVNATVGLAALGALLFLAHVVLKKTPLRLGANIAMAAGAMACLVQLVTRYARMIGIDPHFFPLSNLFESIMYLVLSIFVLYLLVDRLFRISAVGLVSAGLITLIMAWASLLPDRMREASPLVPALQSIWLKIHVGLIVPSYAAFFLAFVAAAIYLVAHYRDRFGGPRAAGAAVAANAGSPITTLELLDELVYRLILLGFPLLALGIVTGALWANHAWGTYWSWDPKETWSLITWLVYAAYLHMRIARDWRGPKAAWCAVGGFVSVLVTYLGVNYLAEGLHSYGKFL